MNFKAAEVKVTRQHDKTLFFFVLCSIAMTSQGGVLPAQFMNNV
jgi:hypothetical protein